MQTLQEARVRAGLSQAKLGKLLGVNANSVSRYETGEREPSAEKMVMLSEILGIPLEDVIKTVCELQMNRRSA